MVKKNSPPEVADQVRAAVPTPLGPEDLMCAPGFITVKEAEYHQLLDLSKKLIEQKAELFEQNKVYKEDLHIIVESLVQLQPLVGNGGFSFAAITNLMKNKDKLAAGLAPMFEVIGKYTTPAQAGQLSA